MELPRVAVISTVRVFVWFRVFTKYGWFYTPWDQGLCRDRSAYGGAAAPRGGCWLFSPSLTDLAQLVVAPHMALPPARGAPPAFKRHVLPRTGLSQYLSISPHFAVFPAGLDGSTSGGVCGSLSGSSGRL